MVTHGVRVVLYRLVREGTLLDFLPWPFVSSVQAIQVQPNHMHSHE